MMESTSIQKSSQINFKFYFKLFISAAFLVLVLSKIPLNTLGASMIKCQWPCMALSLVTVNLCMLVSTLKWWPLLNVQQVKISFAKLLSLYYVGLYANNFLPSSFGGDVLRIYDVAKISGKTKEAAASVIMERILASLALALTAALALMLVSTLGGNSLIYWLVGGILAVCVIVMGVLFAHPFDEKGLIGRWLCRLGKYKEYPYTLLKVLLLSFLFQGLLVVANVFIFQALALNIPLLQHFLYIPVIMAVSMLPISINGIGVREGMYVMLYGFAGIEPASAIACSLLFFVLVTVTSLVGGVIWAIRK